MNQIEVLVILILLIMTVPDLSRKLRRPTLAYPMYILFGMLLSLMASREITAMLIQAGQVGLLLLLFEVGLEIDLPEFRTFWKSLRFGLTWTLAQFPFIFLLASLSGLTVAEALLAASVLTGCSVGMSHHSWKHYRGMSEKVRTAVLHAMVALEMLAIVGLSLHAMLDGASPSLWLPVRLTGIAAIIWLISRLATHVDRWFNSILGATTHWRVHLIVVLLLAVCAVGERLGFSAIKTAFFLGLFMSRSRHEGSTVEETIAPISQRFLIPLLFVALGLQIGWRPLINIRMLLPLATAVFLLGWREILHRRWLPSGGGPRTFLLFGPNLTIAALGAAMLLQRPGGEEPATWLLMSGFFLSIGSIVLLPPVEEETA
ncbi:MAG: cation:proton antiporter [Chrysiogenia bacterium]